VIATDEEDLLNISILMADSGGGHRTAAVSLTEALEGVAQVTFLNLMDEHAPFPFNQFSSGYGSIVNLAPWFYTLIYNCAGTRRRVEFTQKVLYPYVRPSLAAALETAGPDLVISVHPIQTDVPLRVLRELGSRAPFVTVVTDPVSPPVAWFCPHVDLCVVATEPAREMALACGLDAERVKVIGLPIRRAFRAVRGRPRALARAQVGMNPDLPLVLMTGGGAGLGKVLPMAQAITHRMAACRIPSQMAIIAGRNQVLLQRLRAEPWPVPVTILGYVDAMADWMAAAELLVTKAGPGTLAEAACVGLPVAITGFVPGQEAGNIAWVTQTRTGVFAKEPQEVGRLVCDLLAPDNPELHHMAVRAMALSHCNAAEEIAAAVLALSPRPAVL